MYTCTVRPTDTVLCLSSTLGGIDPMRPLRVAVLDPGGFTPPYTHNLCSALGQQGHNVRLFTSPSDFMTGSVSAPQTYCCEEFFYRWVTRTFEKGHVGRLPAKGLEHVWDSARLVAALERWQPDVVHVQWFPLPLVDGLVFTRVSSIAPIVHTVHDSELLSQSRLSHLRQFRIDHLRRQSAHLIAHTEYTQSNLLARREIESASISIIPHGLLHRPRDPTSPRRDHYLYLSADGDSRILFFGSIKPYKGLETLVRAFSHMPREVQATTTLHVAGRARMDLGPIKELAAELDVADRIEWDLGHIDDVALRDAFDRATVVALPYRRIDQSGVLLTAIARGVPVVASTVGGFPETIHDGTHGHLVPPNEPKAFGSALSRVLADHTHRSQLETRMEALAREWPSWETIAAETVSVYRQTL